MSIMKRIKAAATRIIKSGDDEDAYSTIIDGKKVDNIVDWAQKLLDEATQNREWGFASVDGDDTFCDQMKKRMYQYENKMWALRTDSASDTPKKSDNYLFPVIEIELAIMFATRPEISFRPTGVEDVPMISALDKVVKKEQDKKDTAYDAYLVRRGKATKLFGYGIGFCGYTYLRNEPVGAHDVRVVDPLGFLWQIGKQDIRSSKYIIEVRRRDKVDVETEFNVKLPEGQTVPFDFKNYCLNEYMFGEPPATDSVIPQVVTVDIYYRDSTRDKIQTPVMLTTTDPSTSETMDTEQQAADPETGELLFDEETSLKYPGTRRIVITGKNVLFDGENIYDHKMIPYVKADNYDLPFRFCGMSEFKQLEDIQDSINTLLTQMEQDAIKLGPGQYEYDPKALADKFTVDDITNESALLLPRKDPDRQILFPIDKPPISQLTNLLLQYKIKAIEIISGASEVSRGVANPEDSGKKVANLDQYATRRMQGPVKHQEQASTREGLMMLHNIKQFLPEDTMWRIAGLNDPEAMGLDVRDNGDAIVPLKDLPMDIEMDADIVPMSSMPTDPAVKLKMLSELKAMIPEVPGPLLFKYAAIFANIPELADEYMKWKKAMDQMKAQVEGMVERIGEATPEELSGVQAAMQGVEGGGGGGPVQ